MGVYSKIISTSKQIDGIYAFVEGTRKEITSGWTFVNGERKQVFPSTETWELVFEQLTSGTYTFNVGFGKYRIEMSAGGGGGATALGFTGSEPPSGGASASAGANGGSGAYGTVSLEYDENTTDTITIVVGSHGNGATRINGTASSTGGGDTKLSDTMHGTEFVVLGGGQAGHARAYSTHDESWAGNGGGFTTTLTDHDLHNGAKGVARENGNYTLGNVVNPSPYDIGGFGGGFSYRSSYSAQQSASNGGDGFVRIYKSNIYPN